MRNLLLYLFISASAIFGNLQQSDSTNFTRSILNDKSNLNSDSVKIPFNVMVNSDPVNAEVF